MHRTLVITLSGPDRAGLIDRFAACVVEHDGNWEESRLVRLAGRLAGLLLVRVPAERADALRAALPQVHPEVDVVVAHGEEADAPRAAHTLSIACADRPGLVHQVSHAIASLGGAVDELDSRVRCAPMSGEPTFSATLRVSLPDGLPLDTLLQRLERLSPDLMVEAR